MATTARDYAAPLLEALLPVPGTSLGACRICHSSTNDGWATCYPCYQALAFLGNDVPEILPVSLSLEGGQLHHALKNYKDSPDTKVRARFSLQLAGLTELFLTSHEACVGDYDIVTCIPSRRGRTAFEAVTSRMGRFSNTYERVLEVADSTIGSHVLSVDRFSATRDLSDETVLVIDDTFTTGASVASATSVLRGAGAVVNTILVVGRHIRRQYTPSAALLDRIQDLTWEEDWCIHCAPSHGLSLF